jgi:enoyl-CoA hydratase
VDAYRDILYKKSGRAAWITLNRPAKLNAVTQLMYRELRHALIRADQDKGVDAVVLTGAGRAFCAGGDLSEVHEMHAQGQSIELAAAADNSSATFRQMENMDKPVICLVNGLAHAAGFVLAMQADITIASDKASFRLPEALRGMSDVYAACHLSSYIGVAKTKYLLMTCKEISAREADDWGFIARVVPHAELESAGEEVVREILETQSAARSWNKLLVNRTMPPFDGRALKETIVSGETMSGTQRFSGSAKKRG